MTLVGYFSEANPYSATYSARVQFPESITDEPVLFSELHSMAIYCPNSEHDTEE